MTVSEPRARTLLDTVVHLGDGDTTTSAAYLARDRGDAPCSRYGVKASDWQPVALALYRVLTEVHGAEPSTDTLDHCASLVVNDSDDPAYTLANDGPLVGIDWRDYVDGELVQCLECEAFDVRSWEEDHCTNCHAMLPTHRGHWTDSGYWCDTCDSPYCELA